MIEYDRDGHVVTIRINNPARMNAVSDSDMCRLLECWRRFRDDDEARVAILTGTGDRAFCAGADLKEMAERSPEELRAGFWRDPGRGLCSTMEDGFPLWKPVIAAINGICVGEGLVMTLGADIRVCSENARFALTEVKVGINTVTGAILLPQLVNPGIAAQLALTGDFITADEALRVGLVNAVHPAEELMARANELATRIADNAPMAVQAVKEVMVRGRSAPFDTALATGETLRQLVRASQDHREGLAAFQEKRKPQFIGR